MYSTEYSTTDWFTSIAKHAAALTISSFSCVTLSRLLTSQSPRPRRSCASAFQSVGYWSTVSIIRSTYARVLCAASGDPERGECGGGEGVRGYDLPVGAQRGNQKEAIHSGTVHSVLHIPVLVHSTPYDTSMGSAGP